jgi:hypothetical protein
MAEKAHRKQARAVMQKRNQMLSVESDDLEWKYAGSMLSKQRTEGRVKSKHGTSPGPIRQNQGQGANGVTSTAVGQFDGSLQTSSRRRMRGNLRPVGESLMITIQCRFQMHLAWADCLPSCSRRWIVILDPLLYGIDPVFSGLTV